MSDKRSRTSGRNSATERSTWRRRPGTPGGARSEAEKLGLTVSGPRRWRVTPAVLAAWRGRDKARLRALLGLEVWDHEPWSSAPCESPVHAEGAGRCRCAVLALRAQILAALGEQEANRA